MAGAIVDRWGGSGTFSGACIPALAEHYAEKVAGLLSLVGSPLSAKEWARFRSSFADKLSEGYRQTPYARFVVSYQAPLEATQRPIVTIKISPFTYDDECRDWMAGEGGEQPFGMHPDAKVVALAEQLPDDPRVLDVGAGTGRNALALVQRGLSVDALEPTAALTRLLMAEAGPNVERLRLIERDLFAAETSFDPNGYALIVMSEVATHFTPAELRRALGKLAPALEPAGHLLFNAFLWGASFPPDELARQVSKTVWSTFLTREELAESLTAHGLSLVSEEDAASYERAHLPPGHWPPTPWFESWASGCNLFDASMGPSPLQLKWLVCQRR